MHKTLIFLALAAFAGAASAQDTQSNDQTYMEFQVEAAVKVRTPAAPVYPERLRNQKIEGSVLVQFVVDEKGQAVKSSFKVLKSNDNAFSEAVRVAVMNTSFYPAQLNGKNVKQIVQQPFKFAAK